MSEQVVSQVDIKYGCFRWVVESLIASKVIELKIDVERV